MENKSHVEGHTAGKQQSLDSRQGLLGPESLPPTHSVSWLSLLLRIRKALLAQEGKGRGGGCGLRDRGDRGAESRQ
jgi:hypothetical protein